MSDGTDAMTTSALTVRVPLRLRKPDEEPPVERLRPPRRSRAKDSGRPARVAVLLATAHRFHEMLRSGAVANLEQLARRLGVTRARVSQVLALTLLAPDIQEAVLELQGGERKRGRVTEVDLREIVAEPEWSAQRSLARGKGLWGPPGAPTCTPAAQDGGAAKDVVLEGRVASARTREL